MHASMTHVMFAMVMVHPVLDVIIFQTLAKSLMFVVFVVVTEQAVLDVMELPTPALLMIDVASAMVMEAAALLKFNAMLAQAAKRVTPRLLESNIAHGVTPLPAATTSIFQHWQAFAQ